MITQIIKVNPPLKKFSLDQTAFTAETSALIAQELLESEIECIEYLNLSCNSPSAGSEMFTDSQTVDKWAQFISRQSKLDKLILVYNGLSEEARTVLS